METTQAVEGQPAEKSHPGGRRGTKWLIGLLIFGVAAVGVAISQGGDAVSPVRNDESVLLFPTAAHYNPKTQEWEAEIHGWVFEPQKTKLLNSALIKLLKKSFTLDPAAASSDIFQERAQWFLVDNEGGKAMVIDVDGQIATSKPSAPNGHFEATLSLPVGSSRPAEKLSVMSSRTVLKSDDKREFGNQVFLIPDRGISVISDIDDTIKVSNVRDHEELCRRTLFEEFEAVPDMASRYRVWAEAGAAFHYVSNSPWQLYDPLAQMLKDEKFPSGTVHLRHFRIQDGSFVSFLKNDSASKRQMIDSLLKRWPNRQFVLVGDSGERDPEIYGEVARAFPQQVVFVAIRRSTEDDPQGARFQSAFRDYPATNWTVFDDAAHLNVPVFTQTHPATP
ncbi:MAG: phosphatase domain-containing protein [Planctomycetaceae bacterium]